MPVLISMLRGVNVSGNNKIKMDALRALYESLKPESPRTYVQSGNVNFRSKEKNSPALAKKIQSAIERKFWFPARSNSQNRARNEKCNRGAPLCRPQPGAGKDYGHVSCG